MSDLQTSPLANHLSSAEPLESFEHLASYWHDMRLTLVLADAGHACSNQLGGHIRRSFLGALSPGASPAARANRVCTWDPPCTLDVFKREQYRVRGAGVSKPYAIHLYPSERDLCVELTVFGMACDWFHSAAEGLGIGLLSILPWSKATFGKLQKVPDIRARRAQMISGFAPSTSPTEVQIQIPVGIDVSNRDATPEAILKALLLRVSDASRWQGYKIAEETSREMASMLNSISTTGSRLETSSIKMPHKGTGTREYKIVTGHINLTNFPADLWPALRIAERCQIGRGSVWGLGRVTLKISNQ